MSSALEPAPAPIGRGWLRHANVRRSTADVRQEVRAPGAHRRIRFQRLLVAAGATLLMTDIRLLVEAQDDRLLMQCEYIGLKPGLASSVRAANERQAGRQG